MPAHKLHLTLGVMTIVGKAEHERAKELLEEAAERAKILLDGSRAEIEVRGTHVLRGSATKVVSSLLYICCML